MAIAAGGVLLLAGTAIPAHFRTVDRAVLRAAGQGTASVLERAQRETDGGRMGPAWRLLEAARAAPADDRRAVRERLERLAAEQPGDTRWGGPNPWLDRHVGGRVSRNRSDAAPGALVWLLDPPVREALLAAVRERTEPAVMALVTSRQVETTSILPPVSSVSGAPMDAALLAGAALVSQGRMHAGLALELERAAMAASLQGQTLALEAMLMDLLAAARWLGWEELATLTERCGSAADLRTLVTAAGEGGERWDGVYAAVMLAGQGAGVAAFLRRHGEAGALEDLDEARRYGEGAVRELVRRGCRVDRGRWRTRVVEALGLGGLEDWLAGVAWRAPWLAGALRGLVWVDGFFLLALGLWYGRLSVLVRLWAGMPRAPDYGLVGVAALAATALALLISERLLEFKTEAPGGAAVRSPPAMRARLRFEAPHATKQIMNEKVIGMLAAFFGIQLAIYLIGLGRVREIRGRPVAGGIKLRLLDNEESLFDAPLYVGIGGSVLALVLRLTWFEDISLMASYSSTLFGILFCFVLKVMHVRPYRQQLILESAETQRVEPVERELP